MKDKFPIFRGFGRDLDRHAPAEIPWAMIAPHEAQAVENHGQTLRRLAERGGLSPCEAVAIMKDTAWHEVRNAGAVLQGMVLAWNTLGAGRMEAFDPCI